MEVKVRKMAKKDVNWERAKRSGPQERDGLAGRESFIRLWVGRIDDNITNKIP